MSDDAQRLSEALCMLRPGAHAFRDVAQIAAVSVKSSGGAKRALSHAFGNLLHDLYLDWDDRPVPAAEADNYRSVAEPVLEEVCKLLEDEQASWDEVGALILQLIEFEGRVLSRAWS